MNAVSITIPPPRQSELRLYWLIFFCSLTFILIGLALDLIFIAFLVPLLFLLVWSLESPIFALSLYLLSFSVSMPLWNLPFDIHVDDFLFPLVVFVWVGRKVFLDRSLFEQNDITKPLSLLVLVALGCIVLNLYRYTSRQILVSGYAFLRLVEYTIPFFIVTSLVESKKEVKALLWIAVIGATWVALFGLYQWIFEGAPVVVSTLSPNHLHIGAYIILAFFLSLGLLYSEKSTSARLFLFVSLCLQVLVLVGSNSRAGWVGFVIGLIAFIILKRSKILLMILLLVVMLFYLYGSLPQTAASRLTQTVQVGYQGVSFDLSTLGRFYVWYGTVKMIFSSIMNFLFGVGMGAFWYGSLFFLPLFPGGATGAHNNFLHVLAELGIIGFLVFVALLFKIAKRALLNIQNSKTTFQKNISVGYFCALLGLIATCFTQETLSVQEASSSFLAFFFVLSGLVLCSIFENNE